MEAGLGWGKPPEAISKLDRALELVGIEEAAAFPFGNLLRACIRILATAGDKGNLPNEKSPRDLLAGLLS